MYLLLVENNFIFSKEIKSLLEKNNIDCEIVNCSSSEVLLNIAEKLVPDIAIIDFDFSFDDIDNIVRKLRQYSPGADIYAFIDSGHYEKIQHAVDLGIDDYMVKPLQLEDVMLRIKMGLQRKGMQFGQAADETKAEDDDKSKLRERADEFGHQFKESEYLSPDAEEIAIDADQREETSYTEIDSSEDELAFESSTSQEAVEEGGVDKTASGKDQKELADTEPLPQADPFDYSDSQSEKQPFGESFEGSDDVFSGLTADEPDSESKNFDFFDQEQDQSSAPFDQKNDEVSQFFDDPDFQPPLNQADNLTAKADERGITEDPFNESNQFEFEMGPETGSKIDPQEEKEVSLDDDELFGIKETDSSFEDTGSSGANETDSSLEDSDLFGTNHNARAADSTSFEELFGSRSGREEKSSESAPKPPPKKNKQENVKKK